MNLNQKGRARERDKDICLVHGKINGNSLEKFMIRIIKNIAISKLFELSDFILRVDDNSFFINLNVNINNIVLRDGIIQ